MSSLTSAGTLSLEKNLDTEITCIPGDYSLVFKVMDKETGITYTTEYATSVTVINSYSKGMMALSSDIRGGSSASTICMRGGTRGMMTLLTI